MAMRNQTIPLYKSTYNGANPQNIINPDLYENITVTPEEEKMINSINEDKTVIPKPVIKKQSIKTKKTLTYPSSPILKSDDDDDDNLILENKKINKKESIINKKESVINKNSSRQSFQHKKSIELTSNTPTDHDIELKNMGITSLFTLTFEDTKKVPKYTIIAMTPLGTIIGITFNNNEIITDMQNNYISIKSVKELMEIEQSWLTNIGHKTDISSIAMCKEGICFLMRNNLGKIEASYFQLDINNNSTNEIVTPKTPIAHPLINFGEIVNAFRDEKTGIQTFKKYDSLLKHLKEEADKINREQITNRINDLDVSIQFMQSLLGNIIETKNKMIEFSIANRIEINSQVEKAEKLLEKKMESTEFSDSDIQKWKHNQERLSALSFNNITITNNMRTYDKFRLYLEELDRETFHAYFSLYSRIITTMDDPKNDNIRNPKNWNLEDILPRTTELLNKSHANVEKVNDTLNIDITNYNPSLHSEQVNILMQHLKNAFNN